VIVSGDSHSKNLLDSPLVTIEASGSEHNLYDENIRYIYTAGIARTGSTFQHVLLCVIGHLRAENVSCSFGTNWEEDSTLNVTEKNKNSTLNVIKMHPARHELRLTNTSLLFTTVNSSNSEWSAMNFTWTGGNIAHTQIYARSLECPLCEVSKYRKIFGLADVEILQLTQYMQYWSILRRCCGSQMTQHLRKELVGCPKSSDPVLLEGKIDYHMCGSWNLTAVEENFVKTKLYSVVPADRLTNSGYLKYLWSKPGDCEASHDDARNGIGFNRLQSGKDVV